jgi:hypothetical protein
MLIKLLCLFLKANVKFFFSILEINKLIILRVFLLKKEKLQIHTHTNKGKHDEKEKKIIADQQHNVILHIDIYIHTIILFHSCQTIT